MSRLAAVTGATGFLGRYVAGALVSAGWRVRILARREPDHPQLAGLPFETVPGDLSDRRALDALIDGADVVIHAAALIKAPNLATFRRINVEGTANLVAALNDSASPKQLILVSSMAAREPHLSDYAKTKREGEDALAALNSRQCAWTVVRPCAIYGAWDKETLSIFRAAAARVFPMLSPREGRLAWIHAADVADTIVRLCGREASGQVFELTDRRVEGYVWDEIFSALEMATGNRILRVPLPAAAVRTAAAVNAIAARLGNRTAMFTPGKAREILHADWGSTPERLPPPDMWQPTIELKTGFRDTVSWYRSQRWLPFGASMPLVASGAL